MSSSEDEEVIHLPGDDGDLWRLKRGQTPERLPAPASVQKVRKRADGSEESSQPAKRKKLRIGTDMTARCWMMTQMIALFE